MKDLNIHGQHRLRKRKWKLLDRQLFLSSNISILNKKFYVIPTILIKKSQILFYKKSTISLKWLFYDISYYTLKVTDFNGPVNMSSQQSEMINKFLDKELKNPLFKK